MKDVGGVIEDLGGDAPLAPPPVAGGDVPKGGGEAGEGGPPEEVPGGLIRFSFCLLELGQA